MKPTYSAPKKVFIPTFQKCTHIIMNENNRMCNRTQWRHRVNMKLVANCPCER